MWYMHVYWDSRCIRAEAGHVLMVVNGYKLKGILLVVYIQDPDSKTNFKAVPWQYKPTSYVTSAVVLSSRVPVVGTATCTHHCIELGWRRKPWETLRCFRQMDRRMKRSSLHTAGQGTCNTYVHHVFHMTIYQNDVLENDYLINIIIVPQ